MPHRKVPLTCPECGGAKWSNRKSQLMDDVKADLCAKCYRIEYQRRFARQHRVDKDYGLTLEEYDALRMSPCALCGASDKPSLADHNHTTGALRGPLCARCNTLVGYLETAGVELVDKAMTYIEERD